jgi:hypothetical protein
MKNPTVHSCTSVLRRWARALIPITGAVAAVAAVFAMAPAWAQQTGGTRHPVELIKLIPINGTAANPSNKMVAFDISWVDQTNGLYYLADRSNAAIDVVDTTGAFTGTPDTLLGQIGGSIFKFAGARASNDDSGPNGVTSFVHQGGGNCIFVTDAPSRVVSINGNVSFVQEANEVSTGGTKRADELAYDPADGLLLVINNADDPPFGTLIRVDKSTCRLSTIGKINLTSAGTNGLVNATNGAEQPVWDPGTQHFYLAIPEVNGPGGGGPNGGVASITTGGTVDKFFPINFCQPSGLALGPNGDLLVNCSTVFDFGGQACKAVVPAPSPAGTPPAAPATCAGIANPLVAICNPSRGCTPSNGSLAAVFGIGGGDEAWFNGGDGRYYVTAANLPLGPSLGAVSSSRAALIANGETPNFLFQLLPTLPPVPAIPGVRGAGTVHSVAANSTLNKIYVPLPANNVYSIASDGGTLAAACVQGCIAVYAGLE